GALKFLLIGVLSTAVMLFGMSLVYGFTGSLQLTTIAERLAELGDEPAVVMSVFLVITGFAFKVSAAPFHFWAPDTYEGSPVPLAPFPAVPLQGRRLRRAAPGDLRRLPVLRPLQAPAFAVLAALTMLL